MYNGYFGFSKRPFASVPQVDQYFPGTAIEAARATLARCLQRGEGAGMVVGPSGTGKTLLCLMLAEQFKDSFQVALLSSGRLSTRRNLFQAILYELGQPYRGMDEGELRLALVDHLTVAEDCPEGMVLLVDEAHGLPLRLLDEIRTLTNVARDGRPRVRLVLAGACVLEERFASPKLDSFSQRLVGRCYLESLNRTETQQYIHAQVGSAGGAGERIFPADACQSIYEATDGVPRLINQVCDHALLLAYVNRRRQIEPAHVEEAWADLQQLPTPCSAESEDQSAGSSVIEFGGLDDQPIAGEPAAEQPAAEQPAAEQPAAEKIAAEKIAVPSLRISPETNQSATQVVEPGEQLERIEQMVAVAEEEFQPAGSIRPEVEIVFDDPFDEQFEQEEVVARQYRQPDGPPEDRTAAVDRGDQETVPLYGREPVAAAEPDDEDLVIVEEDYDDAGTAAACRIIAVRGQEYGRLFAKLRRG